MRARLRIFGLVALVAAACQGEPLAPTPAADPRATGDAPRLPMPATGALVPAQNGPSALLYAADGMSFTKANLMGTGRFTTIDELGMGTVPPLATLLQYTCVLAWTNTPPSDPVGIGNRLAEYVDAGGTVILSTYALSKPSAPWELMGGIMAPGYNPLALTENTPGSFPRSLDFGTAMTGHPILSGVSDFTYGGNSNYVSPTLAAGATLVATDDFGVPLIGVREGIGPGNGNVVGINLYPGDGFTKSAGVWTAYANACGLEGGDPCTVAVNALRTKVASMKLPDAWKAMLGGALDAVEAGKPNAIQSLRGLVMTLRYLRLISSADAKLLLKAATACG